MSDTTNFNLLDEEWIPVLRTDGRFERVGIRRALSEAGSIRQIAASNPMDNVALLRFMLAVLLWCKDDAKSALAALSDESRGIPNDWLTKLDGHNAAFNLLGNGERFYQDASLKNNVPRPIADLLVEFPGADSVNHMRHVVHDGSYGFCPACCTLGILRLSVWAPANAFYPASVNPGSAAYAVTEDKNLLLTLRANMPNSPANPTQAPWTLHQPPDLPDAIANLAWRPRKLWLNVADNGHCEYCGRPGTLVKGLCIEKGWPTPVTTGQQFGKDVLAEFQKLNGSYKAKATDRRKLANMVVKLAPVILKCRMLVLLQADSKAAQAPLDESDAAKIARVFDQLYTAGNQKTIKELTKKPTKEEKPLLDQTDTQVKKFWVEDPHLLKETEAIGLPDLSADVSLHASKFWRDALRLRGAKAVAIGIVGDGQYIFHDTPAVYLPDVAAAKLASFTMEYSNQVCGIVKAVTPNPDRQHPEVHAAAVLMTPETEAQIRAALDKPTEVADDEQFLRDIYQPVVEQVVDSTTKGSPLRHRAAKDHARALLNGHLKRLVDRANQPAGAVTADVSAKPKHRRKKKEAGA